MRKGLEHLARSLRRRPCDTVPEGESGKVRRGIARRDPRENSSVDGSEVEAFHGDGLKTTVLKQELERIAFPDGSGGGVLGLSDVCKSGLVERNVPLIYCLAHPSTRETREIDSVTRDELPKQRESLSLAIVQVGHAQSCRGRSRRSRHLSPMNSQQWQAACAAGRRSRYASFYGTPRPIEHAPELLVEPNDLLCFVDETGGILVGRSSLHAVRVKAFHYPHGEKHLQ